MPDTITAKFGGLLIRGRAEYFLPQRGEHLSPTRKLKNPSECSDLQLLARVRHIAERPELYARLRYRLHPLEAKGPSVPIRGNARFLPHINPYLNEAIERELLELQPQF